MARNPHLKRNASRQGIKPRSQRGHRIVKATGEARLNTPYTHPPKHHQMHKFIVAAAIALLSGSEALAQYQPQTGYYGYTNNYNSCVKCPKTPTGPAYCAYGQTRRLTAGSCYACPKYECVPAPKPKCLTCPPLSTPARFPW